MCVHRVFVFLVAAISMSGVSFTWAQHVVTTITRGVGPSGVSAFGTRFEVLGDLNGDNRPEIAVLDPFYFAGPTSLGGGSARVWIISPTTGNGSTVVTINSPSTPGFGGTPIASGDVTGDGLPDLMIHGPLGVHVYALPSAALWLQMPGIELASGIGDVSGDGIGELLVKRRLVTPANCGFPAMLSNELHTLEVLQMPPSAGGSAVVLSRETSTVNNCTISPPDLKIGVVLRSLASERAGSTLGSYFVQDDPPTIRRLSTPGTPLNPQSGLGGVTTLLTRPLHRLGDVVNVGDLDGDSIADYVRVETSASTLLTTLGLYSGANDTTIIAIPAPGLMNQNHWVEEVDDVNRDGVPDLLVFPWTTSPSTSAGIVSGIDLSELGRMPWAFSDGRMMLIGDIDGDGLRDVVASRVTSFVPAQYAVEVWSLATTGVTYFGDSGSSAPGGPPITIGVTGNAIGGGVLHVHVGGAPAATQLAMLVYGLSTTTWSGFTLPLDLNFIGLPNRTLYVAPDLNDFALPQNFFGNVTARYSLMIPPIPVSGVSVSFQWILDDLGPTITNIATSDAATVIFQ